jgi:hypothetical protein
VLSYAESSAPLIEVLKSGLFSSKDLLRAKCAGRCRGAVWTVDAHACGTRSARRLFLLHRKCSSGVEGGLAVRTTVQLNLFGGSVANLGDETQRAWLDEVPACSPACLACLSRHPRRRRG